MRLADDPVDTKPFFDHVREKAGIGDKPILSMADYHAAPGMSKNGLDDLHRSPAHYRYALEHPEESYTRDDRGLGIPQARYSSLATSTTNSLSFRRVLTGARKRARTPGRSFWLTTPVRRASTTRRSRN